MGNAPGSLAFSYRRRTVTIVGVVYVDEKTPRLFRSHGVLAGPLDKGAIDQARAGLMRCVSVRLRMKREDIEVHDVMIFDGHAVEVEPLHADEKEAA